MGDFPDSGKSADPFAEPELLTVAAAFERFADIDLLATIGDGEGDRERLAVAASAKVRIADDDTWSDIFSKVLVEYVEPRLGRDRFTSSYEYPLPEGGIGAPQFDRPSPCASVSKSTPAALNWPTDLAN